MKKILLTILLLLSFIVYSQNLTFDELLSIKGKELVSVEEYLTSNNWEYNGVQKNTISFTYGKNESYVEILCFYYETKIITSFVIMFYSNEKYKFYLDKIKSLKCELVTSKITDKIINKVYSNGELNFHIDITKKDKNTNKSLYSIFVVNNVK